jgi:transcription elongation factor Elf1
MDEQNKDVTNKIEVLEEKVEKKDATDRVLDFFIFLLVVIAVGAFVGLFIWDNYNDHKIEKQKARIEELEERLNYKTTVEIGPLPCPFCGSELVETKHDHYHGYYIHCEECGGQTGFPYSLLNDDEVTMSEAIEMWNKMAGMEVREQLKQETEEE